MTTDVCEVALKKHVVIMNSCAKSRQNYMAKHFFNLTTTIFVITEIITIVILTHTTLKIEN